MITVADEARLFNAVPGQLLQPSTTTLPTGITAADFLANGSWVAIANNTLIVEGSSVTTTMSTACRQNGRGSRFKLNGSTTMKMARS